jgi:uncharacterized protein YlxW (UPF0749 family)
VGDYSWIAPVVIAAISATVAWFTVLRQRSGRIGTTEAAKLWDEAGSLREIYLAEINRLRIEIEQLQNEVETCEKALDDCGDIIRKLKSDKARLIRRVERLENHATH